MINVDMNENAVTSTPQLFISNTGRQLPQFSEIILCHGNRPVWLVGYLYVTEQC